MANLTSANVRTIQAWTEGGLNGKRRVAKRVEIFDATVGGLTNQIPASAFGMRVVEETTAAYNADTTHAVATVPSASGGAVYLYTALDNNTDPADAVIANTPTGLYFTVKGY